LTYAASPQCPKQDAFLAELRRYTEHWRPANPGEAARTFELTLAAAAPSRGVLRVREVDGEVATRIVGGDTCGDVLEALVLAVALAIDPRAGAPAAARSGPLDSPPAASLGAAPEAPPSAATSAPLGAPSLARPEGRPGSPATPSLPSPSPTPRSEPPAPPRGPQVESADEAPRNVRFPQAPVRVRHVELANALRAGLVAGVSPASLVGLGAWVEVDAFELAPGWSPAVRLGVEQGAGTARVDFGAQVSFEQTSGALDACPQSWTVWRVSLRACAHVDVGLLRPHTLGVVDAPRPNALWLDVGVSSLVRVALAGPFFADVDGRVLVPITRDYYRFHFNDDFYQISAVAGTAGLSLGARLP
jgi:hypothetical protein